MSRLRNSYPASNLIKKLDVILYPKFKPVDSDGHVFAPNEAYLQAKKCLQIIKDTLTKLDMSMSKIVRTRMFVTDISKWELFGKAHREFFESHPPTTTMVEVNSHARLLAPLPT